MSVQVFPIAVASLPSLRVVQVLEWHVRVKMRVFGEEQLFWHIICRRCCPVENVQRATLTVCE